MLEREDKTDIIESNYEYYFGIYSELKELSDEDYMEKPNVFLGALKFIGEHCFEANMPGHPSKLTEDDLRGSFGWYVSKCNKYNFMPTMNNYSVLIRTTIQHMGRWRDQHSRVGTHFSECMNEFYGYCETAMSNATLAEEVPVVSGIFHLKASHGWDDQPKPKPIEVVHTVAALADISERYNLIEEKEE